MLTNRLLALRRLVEHINQRDPSPGWRGPRLGLNEADACKRNIMDAADAELELEVPPDELESISRLVELAGCVEEALAGDRDQELFGRVVSATSRLRTARRAAMRRPPEQNDGESDA